MSKSQNLATLQSFEVGQTQPLCETCYASLHFNLVSPNGAHKLDLSTILTCLELAQSRKAIPILDVEWWNRVRGEHG